MYRLRYYLDGLVHWLVANSRHGTHSPFVYRLVEEVIYPPRLPGEPRNKVERLIARLIDTYQPASPLDFVIIDGRAPIDSVADIDELWPQLHAGSVVVLQGIHRDRHAKKRWCTIKAKPEVTVTVDLFRVGLVFFHSGQAKEDFKIRY